ncbi:hypothetical protein C3B58_11115 [Lactonifactor longoviformis]|uniref:Uncharacterized protein n=1 Tax=Lactonifactor longoviformis DSM 17459 TaxID=1122155 RepID=A0A1M5AQJ5_9CLOT|nr:hypothetical protein [Lactonifactor longoviformis]POP32628.1 hypothetical protein C3B58_11115 [Lactonifactor longoviformis]SHF32531.1 hypothetical protein SAMN02745158_03306 [Lactonifactor longoviformis DSM 17459]
MLDLERIRQMTKLASYEAGEGKTYLPISKYYRSDFIGLALIKNFFLVSIGYCMILAVIAGYNAEYLLNNAHKLNVVTTVIAVVAGYVVLLVLYSIVTYIYTSVKYSRAKKSIQQYYIDLNKLKKMYDREEKRNIKKNTVRRKRA